MSKNSLLAAFLFLFFIASTSAQDNYVQYFDGADTSAQNSILINIDLPDSNTWQIGPPQKNLFNEAASPPNVLVTDTLSSYPPNDSSSFHFILPNDFFGGILAIQWLQKIDTRQGLDGGVIEYSLDNATTWNNVVNDPYVYNYYGYDNALIDTLSNGEVGFTGMDTTWADVWLCFDVFYTSYYDPLQIRFTFYSDSVDVTEEQLGDGWMIDNLSAHITWIHTVNEEKQDEYMTIYPNPSNGIINIETKKLAEHHIIEKIELVDMKGNVVKQWGVSPTKFRIDISDQAPGAYLLNVTTNKEHKVFKVFFEK